MSVSNILETRLDIQKLYNGLKNIFIFIIQYFQKIVFLANVPYTVIIDVLKQLVDRPDDDFKRQTVVAMNETEFNKEGASDARKIARTFQVPNTRKSVFDDEIIECPDDYYTVLKYFGCCDMVMDYFENFMKHNIFGSNIGKLMSLNIDEMGDKVVRYVQNIECGLFQGLSNCVQHSAPFRGTKYDSFFNLLKDSNTPFSCQKCFKYQQVCTSSNRCTCSDDKN